MRSGIRVVNLALLVSTGLLAMRALPAQSLSPCVRQVRLSVERDIFMPTTRSNVRPAYTATVKQTFEQPLSDGNTIRWTVEAVERGKGNCRGDHMVGFVRALGQETLCVVFL